MQLSAGTQQKKWLVMPPDNRAARLAKTLKVSPLLAQVLINRGIIEPRCAGSFLRPKLTELIEPAKMPGVKAALKLIKHAIEKGQKITIYGDYDVDGITGVSILWQVLTLLNADVDYYIPHRIDEGYGLNPAAVRSLAQGGTKLLITVDCGANAINSADLAGRLGLDLIITDHHQFGAVLPAAAAVVHPALEKSYANQDSCGSMVAFKLAWAVANEFAGGRKLEGPLREFMINATSLAAMGTVADVVDLRGENRVLTSCGLKALPQSNLCGLQALIASANLTGQGLDSFHIGFRLAPMLNAAGRMGHARLAVELLTSSSQSRCREIAEYLRHQNNQRQRCVRKILKQAREMILADGLDRPGQKTIVLARADWHSGVIGIVASRIVDKFTKPTIMINTAAGTNGAAAGSARSIPAFDILSAIRACSEHLLSFGGHKMAAGITIEAEKIERFKADFEAYAQQNLAQEHCSAKLHIDAAAPLSTFNAPTISQLQMLEPFGKGNPEPLFVTKAVSLASPARPCGSRGDHLQLAITDHTAAVRCIGFGMGKLHKKLLEQECFNVAYRARLNTYNGSTNVELVLADIQLE